MKRESAFWLLLAAALGVFAWWFAGLWIVAAFLVYGWAFTRRLEEFHELAIRDSLTGTYSHAFLLETLRLELPESRGGRRALSIVMLDVDDFKRINDENGHPVGDAVLRDICRLIRAHLRSNDVLCRYGGDEFAIVMPDTSLERAEAVADRIRLVISESRLAARVTVSIGVAEARRDPLEQAEDLIRRADSLLYRAKLAGRNRTMV